MCTSSPPSYKYSLSEHTKSIPYFQRSTIMEHNMQYLMWLQSKQILNSHCQLSMNSFNTSWEEQAFAEDAAGPLGGFVWPPRSYSCTFCRREFRSAQALGGHMNVHRRDRARLKQSLSTEGGDSPPFSSPNSRASATVISQENSSGEAYVSPLSSSSKMELQQKQFPCASSPGSNSVTLLSISNFTTATGRSSRKEELMVALDHDDTVETNLSIGTNLQSGSRNEDSAINSKRHKSSATFPFYHKPCSSDRYPFQCEVLRMKTTMNNSIDDIDLELRLGDSPAVK